jgi:hypothetical protein
VAIKSSYHPRDFYVEYLVAAVFAITRMILPIIVNVHSQDNYLALFFDDFYFYLKIALNIVSSGISTFDGTTITNGYHPLWMGIIVLLLKFTGGDNFYFFLLFSFLIGLLNTGSFLLLHRILWEIIPNKGACFLLAFGTLIFQTVITASGMEVSLTIPLILLLVFWIMASANRDRMPGMISLGFLSSLIVLSRLDSAILILIFLPFVVVGSDLRKIIKHIMAFGVGGLLVPIYFAFNHFWLGSIMPTSGVAKHLKPTFHFSLPTFNSLFNPSEGLALYVLPSAIASICGILVYFSYRKTKSIYGKAIAPVLIFPIIYYPLLSLSSDWQLWFWYFYPIVIAAPISVALIFEIFISKRVFRFVFNDKSIAGAFTLFLLIMFGVLHIFASSTIDHIERNSIYYAALKIRAFEQAHPGRYAMGDRVGVVAYLIDSPVVQTEGLVMDKHFLEHIRKQDDLIAVLKEYCVNYYIATNPANHDGCYEFTEPAQAGDASPKMRGKLCQEPILYFRKKDFIKEWHTAVFEITQPYGPPSRCDTAGRDGS